MDNESRAVVELRVSRADEELQAARNLIRDGLYRIAASRAYYAAFLMTTALLFTKDVVRAKHSGVQSVFGEMWVKPGIIEEEYGRIYTRLRKTREESDYSDRAMVTEEIARERLAEAEQFVQRLAAYLRDVGAL